MSQLRIGRRDALRLGVGAGLAAAFLPACGKSDGNVDSTAIVIGSGFGGAVSALRLTQAGIKTLILERGLRWSIDSPPQQDDPFCTDFEPDGRAFWLRTKTATPVGPALDITQYLGVLDRVDGEGMNVYRGAGYGGGSLVYGGITLQPSRARFDSAFKGALSYDELTAKYYPRAWQMMSPAAMPADVLAADQYTYIRTFQQAVNAAKLKGVPITTVTDWDIIRQELAGTLFPSAIHGELIYGNNTGSKVSLDRTYLKQAEQTGLLTVQLQSLVRNVSVDSNQRYVVDLDLINETGDVVRSQRLTSKYLFLAAGSLGTTGILLQSRESGGLSHLDENVGQNWGTNGDTMFGLAGYSGPTGTMQGGPPGLGIDHDDNSVAQTYVELAQYPKGYESHSTLHLGVTQTPTLGQLVFDKDSGKTYAKYPQSGIDEVRTAMLETIGRLKDANAGVDMDTGDSPTGFIEGFTYHPLGGAAMNKVCDTYGRVNGYKGLYVVDASLLPGNSVGLNPALTIAAVAERAIEDIIAKDLKG